MIALAYSTPGITAAMNSLSGDKLVNTLIIKNVIDGGMIVVDETPA